MIEHIYECAFVGLLCKYKTLLKARTGTHKVLFTVSDNERPAQR